MVSTRFVLRTVLLTTILFSQFTPFGNRNVSFARGNASRMIASAPTPSFDFVKEICSARWMSGAGQLPCPSTDGDVRGFALSVASPKLETGVADSAPGLLVSPQNKTDGYIQGFFPEYTVQSGDHFQASVGCAYGTSCYVTYRLDYQINNGTINILWSWKEKNDGLIYQLDKDLSSLAGKKVRFILTLLATGSAANDRAIWGQPHIVSIGSPVPTGTAATPPVVTPPPPSGSTLLDFAASACSASWRSGAGALPCPGTDADSRGFVLLAANPKLENGATDSANALVLFPQNKFNGYIQGTYPEIAILRGDHFQGIVNCAYGSPCYVTFRLDYQIGTASPRIFWSWTERNEGLYYRVDKDLSALAGQKVKFTLTILASGYATGDRALWSQPRIVRTTSTPPTPTSTAIPSGNVTDITASVRAPDFVNCAGNIGMDLLGTITTNGSATVKYHWEISGTVNNSTPENTLVYSSAGTQSANVSGYTLNCGSYTAKLIVTSPNALSAQTDFTLSIPTLLPIYDFNTFGAIGTLACTDVANYAWRQEACNGESGGCWIAQPSILGNTYAGFFRHDANTICGMNLP